MKDSDFNSPSQLYYGSLEYLKKIKVIYVDKFTPFILSSIGAHVANIRNRIEDRAFYGVTGGMPDLRLHIMMVAPPGYSKTFIQEKFFSEYDGIAKTFPNKELETITEAGLVGSFDQEGRKMQGMAEEEKYSILWSEEFAAHTKMQKVEHSINLDTAFLKLLDDGKVGKRLRGGSIDFQSYSTIHAGTQNERLDLASGMTRRLFIIDGMPDEKDIMKYKLARKEGRGVRPNWDTVGKLRQQFKYFYDNFKLGGDLIFDSTYDDFLYGKMNTTHVEDILFEKLAIGYNVMTNYKYGDKDLVIKMDAKLKEMFKVGWMWRNIILGENTTVQILKLVREREWPEYELKKRLISLGIPYAQSSARIQALIYRGVLQKKKDKPNGRGRPRTWIAKGDNWFDYWNVKSEKMEESSLHD